MIRTWIAFSICLFGASHLAESILAQDQGQAGNAEVQRVFETFQPRGVMADASSPTPPNQALASFTLRSGVEIELVASEPDISQPLFLSWDSKGRLWVVEYRQYQFPAGLKIVEYDHHLRAVFDKTPEAPPNHVRGKDRITVFEDTNGDGVYDSNRVVIDGLNIATSVCIGDGGIWVLNPPYLLRYPDADGDARVDGPPEVKLSGFGLQDTHAVANSLMFGPDGWIYGANGSTTTGNVFSRVTEAIRFEGQCIWRFHPKTEVFEIYAEGGGNTFSLDIDSAGRVFSGTNGGNTRGWYYAQGSYSRKNWGKHGPLTNPHAYGFFEAMRFEGDGRRFPQAFAIYEGGLFNAKQYDRTIVAPNAMQNLVWHSQIIQDGSTFRTVDNDNLAESNDRWFRPVYCGVGPDGAVYIADWYDTRLSHVSPTDDWHKSSGRVYRLRPSDSPAVYSQGDLSTAPEAKLLQLISDSTNKWIRQRAGLELGWRDALSARTTERLQELADAESRLEAIWALSIRGALSNEFATLLLENKSADVRRCTVRLLGDQRIALESMVSLATRETNLEVRSQLAATAKRLPASSGLQIVSGLLSSADDSPDLHIPLLCWWAVEAHADDHDAIANLVSDSTVTAAPIFEQTIASRLARRYASAQTAQGFAMCERLLALTNDANIRQQHLAGMYEAIDGRPDLVDLPAELSQQIAAYQDSLPGASIAKSILRGEPDTLKEGLRILNDRKESTALRMEVALALGQVGAASAEQPLLKLATNGSSPPALQRTCIEALSGFSSDDIAHRLVAAMDSQVAEQYGVRDAALRVLASRETWATILLEQVKSWRIKAASIPADVVVRLRSFPEPRTSELVESIFGKTPTVSTEKHAMQINQLKGVLQSQSTTPDKLNGKRVFATNCGTCHQLFGEGHAIGPALDNYDRGNLDFWLPAIVAPSLEIREGYQSYAALLESGRVVSGMIAAQTLDNVTIRMTATDGSQLKEVKLNRSEIDDLRAIPSSLMPENILDQLSESETRDLFAYIMSKLGPKRD